MKDEALSNNSLETICSCLEELLKRPVLKVALRQRAKFEGWLKVELAHLLEEQGVRTALEAALHGTSHRADIRVDLREGGRLFIMLKTVNTNFRFRDVETRGRPITRNITGVIEDLNKLRAASQEHGLVVFPIFPVAADEGTRKEQLALHVNRVKEEGRCFVEREGFMLPSSSGGDWGISWFIMRPQLSGAPGHGQDEEGRPANEDK